MPNTPLPVLAVSRSKGSRAPASVAHHRPGCSRGPDPSSLGQAMPIEIQTLPCNFSGDFKVGDNLVYNTNVLCALVEGNPDHAFNKMIVVQIGSIIEASLGQIIYRAQNFNREGVPNIVEADRQAIEGKKIDKFAVIIDVMPKYHVLDGLGGNIYDDLHTLRRYRNKVHIQDDIGNGVSRDEDRAFSNRIVGWAIDLDWAVIEHLSVALRRPRHIEGYVGDLRLPRRV